MNQQLMTAIWEITAGCNLSCKHCGSACSASQAGELSTSEALCLCDQIAALGVEWVTLSGGEPLLREDWNQIAARLDSHGVIVTMITNAWLFDEQMLNKAKSAGVNTIAVSLDGTEATHDLIRRDGSFQRALNALEIMKQHRFPSGVITTVHQQNLSELNEIKQIISDRNIYSWQLQIALPMGNMSRLPEWIIRPEQIDAIIDFAYETTQEGRVKIKLADCLGYYTLKEREIRKSSTQGENFLWNGCSAGKNSIGILHNGNIVPCTSIRDPEMIVGNIRQTPLKELWEDQACFRKHRGLTKDLLNGFCKKCRYSSNCLGGCSNLRITSGNGFYGENHYCSYRVAVFRACDELLEDTKGWNHLISRIKWLFRRKDFQLAELLIAHALKEHPNSPRLLNYHGFAHFMLGNFLESKSAVEKSLKLNPNDAYALNALGLSLCRSGEVDYGIEILRKSITLADPAFTDPYYDLAVILSENNRIEEALTVLNEGQKKSKTFIMQSQPLLEHLLNISGKDS